MRRISWNKDYIQNKVYIRNTGQIVKRFYFQRSYTKATKFWHPLKISVRSLI